MRRQPLGSWLGVGVSGGDWVQASATTNVNARVAIMVGLIMKLGSVVCGSRAIRRPDGEVLEAGGVACDAVAGEVVCYGGNLP